MPYEAPFEGKIVAWSITLAKPSTKDSATTTNEVGFFNEFLGQPAEARIGVLRPVDRLQAAPVHAGPPESDRGAQPLLRQHGRSSPSTIR